MDNKRKRRRKQKWHRLERSATAIIDHLRSHGVKCLWRPGISKGCIEILYGPALARVINVRGDRRRLRVFTLGLDRTLPHERAHEIADEIVVRQVADAIEPVIVW